jgi:hypothetical protein
MLGQAKSVTIYILSTEEYCYTSRSIVNQNAHKGCPCIDMMQTFYSRQDARREFNRQFDKKSNG